MISDNIKLLLQLYFRPLTGMSDIIDRGNWLFGALLVTATAILLTLTVTNRIYTSYEAVPRSLPGRYSPRSQPVSLQPAQQPEPPSEEESLEEILRVPQQRPLPIVGMQGWWLVSFSPASNMFIAFSLAVLYVPALILLLTMLERTSGFGVAFRRDYGSLLSCAFFGWAASHLPFALLGFALDPLNLGADAALGLWLLGNLYFGVLMFFALRTACGASTVNAGVTVGLAWLSLRLDSWVFSILTFSPFLTLIWLVPLALGALAAMRAAHIQRQSFRRYLQACTINDHDAEAHYQLGLIYQQRRQSSEALKHFRRAVEIDPKEPDANYQLGIAARREGRLQDALNHFTPVVRHDDKYRQSEIWREIGATYLAAGMLEEAKSALEKYNERRPFDPEGLYHLGETMEKLGESKGAQELFQRCVEAVKTMPYYRRNEVNKWSRLAQSKL
ncbi:MAG TPA: tetratricopeptide repeat protein [Blastocatellia bacterium]|nr:tetratricopeptide repeat protein [Blastocatellia bacterium]